MEKLKKIIKLISGLGIASASLIISLSFPLLTIVGIPTFIIGLSMSYDGLMKKDIKHNIFKVSKNENELIENPFRIDRFIKCMFGKNKVKNFLNESMNCFKQLDVYENNQKVKYKMKSHGFTKKRLEELQKLGYIENLETKVMYNGKKKSFFLENLAMGNFKQLFKKKEKFEMNFNLTGKSFYNEEIQKYVDYVVNKHNLPKVDVINNDLNNGVNNKVEESNNNKKDNIISNNNQKEDIILNSRRDVIDALQKFKEEALNSKYNNQEQVNRASLR